MLLLFGVRAEVDRAVLLVKSQAGGFDIRNSHEQYRSWYELQVVVWYLSTGRKKFFDVRAWGPQILFLASEACMGLKSCPCHCGYLGTTYVVSTHNLLLAHLQAPISTTTHNKNMAFIIHSRDDYKISEI